MRRLLLAAAFIIAFSIPAFAEDFTRAQIEAMIGDYIASHPKEMIDSVEKYGKDQQATDDKSASEAIIKNREWLEHNPKHAEAGNPKGDVTIVEFFDYNCGYCKQALGDLMTLLDADKNLRLVFVEIPILGDTSVEAARWALAAKRQDLYLEYHIGLMRHHGPLDESVFLEQASKAGLNVDTLKLDHTQQRDNFDSIIAENLDMARTLGIQGTPAFVIGDELIRGYVGSQGLLTAISDARKNKK